MIHIKNLSDFWDVQKCNIKSISDILLRKNEIKKFVIWHD